MAVLIAETWITSATRLTGADAKRVWEFCKKIYDNPAHPGLSLERATDAKDKHMWSGRITQDLRAIFHHDGDVRTLLYVGRHDDAYAWASTHSVKRNVATGALQIVTSPETVAPAMPARPAQTPGRFNEHGDAYLLSLGLPPEWLPTIREIVTDEQLMTVTSALPEEVGDRLLAIALGELVIPPSPITLDRPAMDSPDTRRRFFALEGEAELRTLLEAPLATWLVFLHPSQRRLATGTFNGPLKITGSAGTGKTVVALHRAHHLAAQGKRVLLTSFVSTLCDSLAANLRLLCAPDERRLITVTTVHKMARSLVGQAGEQPQVVTADDVRQLLRDAADRSGCPFDLEMLVGEWTDVVQAQGLTSWEGYRSASRTGRGTPLSMKDRRAVWTVMEAVHGTLRERGQVEWAGLCRRARELLEAEVVQSPVDAVIADEVQDLGPQELLFLGALAGLAVPRRAGAPVDLVLVGDGGQRIYGRTQSFRSLGIDVRGRSHVLYLNYRTSEQIRRFADHILGDSADDLEGGRDDRQVVRSLFSGPSPALHPFATAAEQHRFIIDTIGRLMNEGITVNEMGVFQMSWRCG